MYNIRANDFMFLCIDENNDGVIIEYTELDVATTISVVYSNDRLTLSIGSSMMVHNESAKVVLTDGMVTYLDKWIAITNAYFDHTKDQRPSQIIATLIDGINGFGDIVQIKLEEETEA